MTNKRAPLTFNVKPVTAVPAQEKPAAKRADRPAAKAKKPQERTYREGRQFIAAHVSPEAAKQFKLLAVQHDKTTQELLVEAINDVFAKHGLSRIA